MREFLFGKINVVMEMDLLLYIGKKTVFGKK